MDKKIKTKWLKALRGGQYDQAKSALCDSGTAFCCLGVLIDIQGAYWDTDDYGDWTPVLPSGRKSGKTDLPPHTYSARIPRKMQDTLARMNDEGATFVEIADYIEQKL